MFEAILSCGRLLIHKNIGKQVSIASNQVTIFTFSRSDNAINDSGM